MFDGDWESGNLDKQMAGGAGFFLMPPAEPGGKRDRLHTRFGEQRDLQGVSVRETVSEPATVRRQPNGFTSSEALSA
jgi:hypothetical protein